MNSKERFTIQDFLIQLEQIDYLEIVKILGSIATYYVTSKTLENYNLYREYNHKNIKKVNLPPELKVEYDTIDINHIASTKLKESLIQFINVMIEKFPKEDLINFYNNINTLKISHSTFRLQNFISKGIIVDGNYDVKKNKITIDEKASYTPIFHELFHMASANYKNGIRYSGFRQTVLTNDIASLGTGINEGYTELLKRRYFAEDNNFESYEYEVFIVEKIEKIIGQDKMESLYLNANLPGLIEELNQYSSEEEIMKLISSIDFVEKHLNDIKIKSSKKEMITNSLKSINQFLIKAYSKKLLIERQQANITNEELTIKLVEYVSSLAKKLTIRENVYELVSGTEIRNCLESVFGKENVFGFFFDDETSVAKK